MQHDSPALSEVLERVHGGRIQLPDFQRNWTWDDARIVSLLATVVLNYPMGVVMTLRTSSDSTIRFKARTLEGAPDGLAGREQELLLDGQQRLTSLYRVLRSGSPVTTKDTRSNEVRRWYYIDIDKALEADADIEDAICSVPADRKIYRNNRVVQDLSTTELECQAGMFPLRIALDDGEKAVWSNRYTGSDENLLRKFGNFTAKVLNPISKYKVHIISLEPDTNKEAVCRVFEKVNTGGVTLNTFELVTATYAADDFELPRHWDGIHDELKTAAPMMEALLATDFLQAVSLVATLDHRGTPVCKRKDLLDLPLAWYKEWERPVVNALLWAGKFLAGQGIVANEYLPYRTQLVPLAAIRTVLGEEADTPEAQEKLLRWYWCGVFGEQYGGSLDSRFPLDLQAVTAWMRDGAIPASVRGASFNATRLETMSSRNSAAYTGVFAHMVGQGCYDWYFLERPLDGETIAGHSAAIGRVFPLGWCRRNGVDKAGDSVLNKALYSQRVAKTIGSRAPSLYVQELERDAGVPSAAFDDALATQFIKAEHLRGDAFDEFCAYRRDRLLELIAATGIPVIRDDQ